MLFYSDSFSNFTLLMTTPSSVDKSVSLLWDNSDPYLWYTEEQVSKDLFYSYRARASYKICGAQLKTKMLISYSRGRVKYLSFLLWSCHDVYFICYLMYHSLGADIDSYGTWGPAPPVDNPNPLPCLPLGSWKRGGRWQPSLHRSSGAPERWGSVWKWEDQWAEARSSVPLDITYKTQIQRYNY